MDRETSLKDQEKLMEGLYWWGVPTLLRCPHDSDPDKCDIALVGVPHSTGNGSTERDQHLGPRAVRDVSAVNRRVHMKFGLSPWETCKIHDLGDVMLPEANNNEKSIERIVEYFKKIDSAGTCPVSIGGDHSITGGILTAISGQDANLTQGRKAALLHFDAHTDAFHNLDHFLGAKKSAAHWASYLVREGKVDASKSIQFGIRGNIRTLDWLDTSAELGYKVITMDDYNAYGAGKCINMINDRLGDAPVYITFDLDCLDPTVAPGVSNIEAGCTGLSMSQAVELLQGIRGKNLIGGDVVCLMPSKDQPNKITSLVASSVMFELISLIADNLKRRQEC
jgi:guanidinopropionase